MKISKVVAVVHPDSKIRSALRSKLETQGYGVVTHRSCAELLTDESIVHPHLILLDRSLLSAEGLDVLSQLSRQWDGTEVVFLPQALTTEIGESASLSQLLSNIDRLLKMRTTREILAS